MQTANELTPSPQQPDKNARTWAMICHLAALSGFAVPVFLFGFLLGPLVVWAIKRDDSPFIDDQGKEVMNFQLTMMIAFFFSFMLMFILVGFLLVAILCLYEFVMILIAAIKANEGVQYRYPLTIRFIK
ncbi:MAG: DUF4870 domain-containing protein [Gammaproteobacteria bacterium]|nr:DUF4870 domain-containing protein [Gammaproteobacteria bacterium]